MTTEQPLDRTTRAWLDLMPDEVADRVIDAVLMAVETAPQVRPPRFTARRLSLMHRTWVAAAAALTVAFFAGGTVLLMATAHPGLDSTGPGTSLASAVPTQPPADSPTASVSPDRRIHDGTWRRRVADGTVLVVSGATATIRDTATGTIRFEEGISVGSGVFTLTTLRETEGCPVGGSAEYVYRMPPGSTSFIVFPYGAGGPGELCAARSSAFVGLWTLVTEP